MQTPWSPLHVVVVVAELEGEPTELELSKAEEEPAVPPKGSRTAPFHRSESQLTTSPQTSPD